jgi:CyaY protein
MPQPVVASNTNAAVTMRICRTIMFILSRAIMTSDSTFIASADATLEAIGAALDTALATTDNDADWSLNDGILEIECEDGTKLIVNRHVPNREIWVAARAGGFHFRGVDGVWLDTRSGEPLATQLGNLLRQQAGLDVDLTSLPSPPPV